MVGTMGVLSAAGAKATIQGRLPVKLVELGRDKFGVAAKKHWGTASGRKLGTRKERKEKRSICRRMYLC